MPTVAFRTYTGTFLQPAIYPEQAYTDAVKLAPGDYVAGQVLGQKTDTITAQNDVQTLTVNATSGTFKLQFGPDLSGSLAWNITAAALQTALEAFTTIGVGNVAVTGGPGATAPLVITFQGALASLPQPDILVAVNAVLGGAATVVMVHTTPGRAVGGIWNVYNDALSDGTNVAKGLLKYPCHVNTDGTIMAGGGEWGTRALSTPAYVAGYFRTADLTGLDAAAIADLGRIVEGSAALLTNTGTILRIY